MKNNILKGDLDFVAAAQRRLENSVSEEHIIFLFIRFFIYICVPSKNEGIKHTERRYFQRYDYH